MPLTGFRVLSLESRRAKEMEALIRREGGEPFLAPSVQERAIEDHGECLRFLERLESGEFDLIICMTAAGLTFLRDQLVPHAAVGRLSEALKKLAIISRGPKPLPVLRELGTKADFVVPEPNTWREIVEAVAERPERRIVVQEYGRPNMEMTAAFEAMGAQVTPMVIYRWELPEDTEPLREAARRLAAREFDAVLFTSSIQLDHLLLIAGQLGVESEVRDALQRYTAIASVGPVMTDSLAAAGLPVDIVPVHPKMAALTKATSVQLEECLAAKRQGQ
jgi:uroporphyrinogen-III synthase